MKLLEWNRAWSEYVQMRWVGQWEWLDTADRAE